MQRVTILLIWFEPTVRVLFRVLCQREGFQSHEFDHVDLAYSALDTHQPDLVIIERTLRSPDDGLGFCQRVRRNDAFRQLPIIVGFADMGPGGFQQAYEAGANGCFGRMFNVEGVLTQIHALLVDPTRAQLVDQ